MSKTLTLLLKWNISTSLLVHRRIEQVQHRSQQRIDSKKVHFVRGADLSCNLSIVESATVRPRHKVDPSVHLDKHSSNSHLKAPSKTSYYHLNGTAHEQPVASTESAPTHATTRLPSPGKSGTYHPFSSHPRTLADDGSPMSLSSTSSKESSSAKASTNGLALHSSFSEPGTYHVIVVDHSPCFYRSCFSDHSTGGSFNKTRRQTTRSRYRV